MTIEDVSWQSTSIYKQSNWKTQAFRQSVVSKIEQVIQSSGVQVARTSNEMENHIFMKAKIQEEYMIMVAKLILHLREMSQYQQNQEQQQMWNTSA